MRDPRIDTLVQTLVHYSCRVKSGERVLIQATGSRSHTLVKALIREVYRIGGEPHVNIQDASVLRELLLSCTEEQMRFMAHYHLECMKGMQAYIGIRSWDNSNELSGVSPEKSDIYSRFFMQPVHFEQRVDHTKWVVLIYPNNAFAQSASMSLEEYEDYYFKICNVDYQAMSSKMDCLAALMEKTDRVRITGKGTDLQFSIKGMPVIKCDGRRNIPDGEVYSAPIRDSVNGALTYTCPALFKEYGTVFTDIRFEFRNGKIVDARSNDTEKLNKILDRDEGARYIGEFALGCNPLVQKPMLDTLVDEKIAGSFHFTPGNCYTQCDNGNRSSIHWDLVCIQTPAYGGGNIYFDGALVRRDGVFVARELAELNPA